MVHWRAAILDWTIRSGTDSPVTGSLLIGGGDRRLGTGISLFLNGRSQLYAQATAEEQLKVREGTEVEAKIYFGQDFTAARSKELGCSYNLLTKKNNLSIHNC